MRRNCRYELVASSAVLAVLVFTFLEPANACTVHQAGPSLAERYHAAEIVAFVRLIHATEQSEKKAHYEFEVLEVAKGAADRRLRKVSRIEVTASPRREYPEYGTLSGFPGEPLLFNGLTRPQFDYMRSTPGPETAIPERAAFFARHLGSADPVISGDALGELQRLPTDHLGKVANLIPLEMLRKWLADPETPADRFELIGTLLGFVGNQDDARRLEAKIVAPVGKEEFRPGLRGMMQGYLLLAGEKGLELIESRKLLNRDEPFSEMFAALEAIRFVAHYHEERLPRVRAAQSFRILLDRPEIVDIAVLQLARWKDWSVLDRVVKLADDDAAKVTKRAVVYYLLAAIKDAEKVDPELPHADTARERLAELRRRYPLTVREVERAVYGQ